jgi:hypothetical protein
LIGSGGRHTTIEVLADALPREAAGILLDTTADLET